MTSLHIYLDEHLVSETSVCPNIVILNHYRLQYLSLLDAHFHESKRYKLGIVIKLNPNGFLPSISVFHYYTMSMNTYLATYVTSPWPSQCDLMGVERDGICA